MNVTRRQKRVGSLIKEEIGRLLVEEIQDFSSCLITVTRVEMSSDLKNAYIYFSVFGSEKKETILERLEARKGHLRKSIASKVKLKYNPMLIFSPDPLIEYEERIDSAIKKIKKNEK
ncbi:MAG: 30S ribosome-binding factor RbfA [Candidatus Aminicenantes bacterium]|nr:MAG: 30S ribosome-binding factor RbfA [Candidatus Aminicenantes bacterium]